MSPRDTAGATGTALARSVAPGLHDAMAADLPPDLAASIERLRRVSRARLIRKRVVDTVFYGTIVVAMGAVLGQAIDRDLPVDVATTIASPSVPAGGKLVVRMRADRHRVCQSRAVFEIFDGEGRMTVAELPWADARGPLGLDKPFERTFTLPRDAEPGEGRLRIERSYRCPGNIFHQIWPIVDVVDDIPFTVAPAP